MNDENAKPIIDVGTSAPSMPELVEETGLEFGFLADLTLKAVYSDAHATSERVAEKLCLPMGIAEALLHHLYREKFIEIRGRTKLQSHSYGILDRGWERAQRLLDVSGYIGAAPVSLEAYTAVVQWQEQTKTPASPKSVEKALSGLVLPDHAVQTLGLVCDSRRSLFLTGPPGSGKTTAAMALHNALEGDIWIPYAIEAGGHVIRVYDPHWHHLATDQPPGRYDHRWIKIRRPLVVAGGELTIESMDLIFSDNVRFYEAPFQMKSNGGVLLIDDFGRQRVEPKDLLNRWIIPLENHVDYLTLHTGKKLEVPFEQLLVFATNLNPSDLVDEAFLRRMGYRLAFTTPSPEFYSVIFERYVKARGLNFEPELLNGLLRRYEREKREMKACEPRDLTERCLDICRYEKRPQKLTPELLDLAWNNYFGV
jgi:predicted ATPase with chaperone activity